MVTSFGVEPQGDFGTCFLGFWIPCVLFGKTHWRLKRVSRGQDASDAAWNPSYGFNRLCLACGVAALAPPLGCILTGIQRSEIRGTYGINGNCASDVVLGIFCTVCTQIQNDREVRAREGDTRMRYNGKFLKQDLVKVEPRPSAPMEYLPGRWEPPFCEPQPPAQPTGHTLVHTEKPAKLQKHEHREESSPDRLQNEIDEKQCPPLGQLEPRPESDSYHMQTTPTIVVTEHQDPKPQAEILGKISSSEEPSSQQQTSPSSKGHSVVTPNHTLSEFVTGEDSMQTKATSSGPAQDRIAEGETVRPKYPLAQMVNQHRLSECEAIPVSKYLHDFPDHPVDKAVIEKSEKESKQSHDHELEECIQSLPSELFQAKTARTVQHTLADCSDDETTLISPAASIDTFQHALADRSNDEVTPSASPISYRSVSNNLESTRKKLRGSGEHRLVSCPTPPVLSHQKVETARINASNDREATQRPSKKLDHSKSQEQLRANQAGATDVVSSASSGTNSQTSTEDAPQADGGTAIRRHKRRHKPSRRPKAKFPLSATDGNQHGPSESAQNSLEKVLAANGGKREKPQRGSKQASNNSQDNVDEETNSAAATMGETSGQNYNALRSEEEPRSPGASPGSVTGFWGKITGGSGKAKGQWLMAEGVDNGYQVAPDHDTECVVMGDVIEWLPLVASPSFKMEIIKSGSESRLALEECEDEEIFSFKGPQVFLNRTTNAVSRFVLTTEDISDPSHPFPCILASKSITPWSRKPAFHLRIKNKVD
ncbi:hypothetical protein MBM_01828 [Drepanopeziza brunnea f. sp. 'multigermtubi' MB_m1]|uniref:Uncharacterized protein n=1 Tax=Marssonina brunnea f. sp. multigermtubi (strain MB_m1) TaxID=1072389 RepID=K1X3Q6_MARBU|nr:uncharacterized protein MBM_01828 [Drepanopeziza brunnea f. sp. 'multigermtubi' MB_m1]EKD19876.1 hypothetical protein MBM_01828 [Drepanopeziza brunnea f. sp. 'multigermtubi' MB_m1]